MRIKAKNRADVKPEPKGLYRLGQAVRILPPGPVGGRIGVVVRFGRTPRGPQYEVALWPGERLTFAPDELEPLPASEHCSLPGLSQTCQPRPNGRCVWCDRLLANWDEATWQPGDLEGLAEK